MPDTKGLFQAAYDGNISVFRKFLLDEEDIDSYRDNDKNTLLSIAAKSGHEEVINFLLAKQANINARNIKGETPFSHAAENGHTDAVEILLRQDNVDSKSYEQAVSAAAKESHENTMKFLLEDLIFSSARDRYGSIALISAATHGSKAIVELLLTSEGINFSQDAIHEALIGAAETGHDDIVETLLGRNDVDINAASSTGKLLLIQAAEYGQTDVVKMLLERDNTDVNVQGAYGRTALDAAVRSEKKDVLELLWAREDLNEINYQGLLWVAAGDYCEDVMDFLLSKACAKYPGRTPLSLSAEAGSKEAVQALLKRDGVDANLKDEDGRTPLSYAAEKSHWTVVQILVRNNADVDLKDNIGRTPLSYAAANEGPKIIRYLLQQNADINLKDNVGRTPLSYAAENGHQIEVEILLQHNADPNLKDNDGRMPLWWAIQNSHEASMKQLAPIDTGTLLFFDSTWGTGCDQAALAP
ncbi:hypothetical protein TrVGV298_006875 [Trichoderma virens]|nr:hypothetical protein TrVGV298_006875 [Trichoderma virens]